MRDRQPSGADGSSVPEHGQVVFEVLENERSRRILAAIREEPKTAPELSETLDIPTSTVYRKLDALVEAGLVTVSTRVATHGNHSDQYECAVAGVHVDVDADGLDVELLDAGTSSRRDRAPDGDAETTAPSPLTE